MALQTPRRLGAPRPSLNNTASQPNLSLAASTAIARKASLNALIGQPTTPTNKMGGDGQEIDVGDHVDVPGGMHGTVKFIGSVRGKKGVFAGVELSREFAARGKNDGDVDGYTYHSSAQVYVVTDSNTVHDTSPPPSPAPVYSYLYIELRNAPLQL